jgi:peptidoglycan/LPS O-acetylase OafA/YrhL
MICLKFQAKLFENFLLDPIWTKMFVSNAIAVDYFFLISGYLVSRIYLQSDQQSNFPSNIVTLILKKCCRMWPALFVSILVSIIVDDAYTYPLIPMIRRALLFEMPAPVPLGLAPMWSNRVDVVASIMLATVCCLFRKHILNRQYGLWISLLFFILSFIPGAYIILNSNDLITPDLDSPPLFADTSRCEWMHRHFNVPLHPCPRDENMMGIALRVYFPWWIRCSVFFISIPLAAVLHNFESSNSSTTTSDDSKILMTSENIKHNDIKNNGIWSTLKLILSLFALIIPCLMEYISSRRSSNPGKLPPTALFIAFLVVKAIGTSGFAYVIYRILLPSNHPLSLKYLKSFLSGKLFQFLGPLTYSAYILHFPILHEIIYRLPSKYIFSLFHVIGIDTNLSSFPKGVVLLIVYSIIIVPIVFAMSYIVEKYIERPFLILSRGWIDKLSVKKTGLVLKKEE